jgi:hypothetical protein
VAGPREQGCAYHLFTVDHLPEAKVAAADEQPSGLDDRILDPLDQPSGLRVQASVVQLREHADVISDRLRSSRQPNF